MTTHVSILVGLAIYSILMMGISLFWLRRVKKPIDYLVGGRTLSSWVLAGNITAGSIGTGVIIGASGLAYQHGWAGSAYPIGLGIGTALAGLIFAGMRRHKFMTLSEEISSYYEGKRVVVEFSNVTLFLSQLCWLIVQIMGGASVIAVVTGMSLEMATVIAGLITSGIALPGGFKSVVYTDFLQATILLIGFGIVTYSALDHTGGLGGLRHTVPPSYFSFLGVNSYGHLRVAGMVATLVFSVLADPGRRLSIYSARSEKGARISMLTAGLIVTMFSAVIGITGMYAYKLNPHLPVPDEALLWLVMYILPAWLAALVVVSVTSGIFSCANGNAMAISTFFVRHIYPLVTKRYPKRPLLAARGALAITFVLSTAVAMRAGTIVSFVLKFLPVTMSGVAIIILFGRFWRRSTWQGALAAQTITPVVSLAVMFFYPNSILNNGVVLAVPGVIALVVVSLLTPLPSRSFGEVAGEMASIRESIEGQGEVKLDVKGVAKGDSVQASSDAAE